ncbi:MULTISPECIES: hypothetical protein [Streptomyces]|uniref:hypothetical protein n=1 Tax=Streptomyces TaxID=1883 RepID=UPI00099D040E|nr:MULTISPECIES: hypothetical protein [Streptomyces]WSQ21753.1 hypothetical protein OG237_32160 [Streptomyces zaomyceticus]
MHEQAEHTEQASGSLTVETDLGPALLQVATAMEEHAEDEAEREATAALAVRHTLPAAEVAALTNRLLTRVEGLAVGIEYIPVCRRSDRGVGVLARWETLKAKGPAPDPLGNWSYMRDLAHLTRDMVRVLREHRAAERPKAFVGRPDRPHLTPGAP